WFRAPARAAAGAVSTGVWSALFDFGEHDPYAAGGQFLDLGNELRSLRGGDRLARGVVVGEVHVEQPVRGSRRAVLLWPDPCALDPLDTGKLPAQRDLIGIAGLEDIRALGVVVNNSNLRTHESPHNSTSRPTRREPVR